MGTSLIPLMHSAAPIPDRCPHEHLVAFSCKRIVQRRPGHVDADEAPASMSWMQRLKRVFAIDIETCPHCRGTLGVIACIEEPPLIARILGYVQQREELNGPLTRAPPGQQEVTFNLN